MRSAQVRAAFYVAVGAILVILVAWPFLTFLPLGSCAPGSSGAGLRGGGDFLWRDMAVLRHMGFVPQAFGGGDLPARNAPQDGLLALFSIFLPATWLLRAMVVSAAAAAAWAGYALARTSPLPAMAIAVFNPFAVERLLQGQWSLAIAAWLLPVIAAAGLNGRPLVAWLALFGASITPTGALLGLATALATVRGRRLESGGIGLALCLPWVVPAVIDALFARETPGGTTYVTDALAGVTAFAPRGEEAVGVVGALLTLGGIWNAEALPPSRAAGFALFGLLVVGLVAFGLVRLSREHSPDALALGALAVLGLGGALYCWAFPTQLAWAVEHVPGAALLRDSQKLVALALPLYVAALGNLHGRWPLIASACVLLQMPDAPASLGVLAPRDAGVDTRLVAELDGRATYFADRDYLIPLHDRDDSVAVDPYSKAAAKVESGTLTVDGQLVDAPSSRWLSARAAWDAGDVQALESLGIGAVVEGGKVVATTNAPAPRVPWVLTVLWLLMPLVMLWAAFRQTEMPRHR